MQENYVLSIQISGSHFTAAVFDLTTRIPVADSYHRVPVSHKADVNVITGIWSQCIDTITSKLSHPVSVCCIAVPAAFDPEKRALLSEDYKLYSLFNQDVFEAFFTAKLGIPHSSIHLISPASALLANEQYLSGGLTERFHAALVVGTDVCGAGSLEYFADDLKWEFKAFKGSSVNNTLSIQWICKRYSCLTGITILNMEQFMQIAKSSVIAKTVLREYLNNLIDFLVEELPLSQLNTLYVSGDIILAASTLKSLLLKRHVTVNLKFIPPAQMSLLAGAVFLGCFKSGFLPEIDRELTGVTV